MSDEAATVAVEIRDPEGDEQELDELARRLRRQLLELDVDAVELASGGPVPAGAKAVEVAAVGALLVTLANTAGGLTALVTTVRSWLGSNPSRSVKLELDGDSIEVTGLTGEQQQRLIDEWLSRRTGR